MKKCDHGNLELLFKQQVILRVGSVFEIIDSITTHECQEKLEWPYCTSKYELNFFHILLCFYNFYPDSTFMENDEETLKVEEYSSPWYCIGL